MHVTGLIALHNHEKWIEQCIEGFLIQTRKPDEIVVVDDGSTDDSYQRVISLLCEPSPAEGGVRGRTRQGNVDLTILRHATAKGPGAARNTGIKFAWNRTDLFALCDSDDYYLPHKIEKSIEGWDFDNWAVVYSDYENFNDDRVLREYKEPWSKNRLRQECLVNCDSVISKRAFSECGLFPEDMRTCEDYMMWARFSKKFIAIHIPECLIRIRTGGHSSTSTVPREVWEEGWRKVAEEFNK